MCIRDRHIAGIDALDQVAALYLDVQEVIDLPVIGLQQFLIGVKIFRLPQGKPKLPARHMVIPVE